MVYYVLHSSEDGFSFEIVPKGILTTRINDVSYYGSSGNFLSEPVNGEIWDEKAGPSGLLIIEGKVIVPKVVESVTRWEI